MVDIHPCIAVRAPDVRRLAALELGVLLVDKGESIDADTTRVRAACDNGWISLYLDDPITGKTLRRRIDLLRVAIPARGRLLALAIAELVAASWIELEATPQPSVPLVDQTASPAVVDAARDSVDRQQSRARSRRRATRRWELGVFGAGGVVNNTGPALGGGIGISYQLVSWFSLMASASHVFASTRTSLGDIRLHASSVGVFARAGVYFGGPQLAGGLGGRFGYAWLTGDAMGEVTESLGLAGAWGGPAATLSLTLPLGERLAAGVTGEVGWVTLPVVGRSQDKEFGMDGVWATAFAGLAVQL